MVGEAEKPVETAAKAKIDEALESATIQELTDLLESKVTELEAEKKDKTELKAGIEAEKKRVSELEKGLADQKAAFSKLKEELEGEKRKPFIEALKAQDKKAVFNDKMLASLETKEMAEITAKLKETNDVTTKIQVTSLETSAAAAQKADPPVKILKIEELEDVAELAKRMDIDTPYGKALVQKIKAKKK